MNFKYPISKEDSTDYNAEELYGILSREKSGHYLLGNHQFWHGGIHFSTETVEQCALKQPIRCIADGEVIAYRINKKYKESKLNTTTLQYSSSFCLVKHEYESPTEPIKTPEKDPSKLNDDWQNKKIETLATGFVSYSDEAYSKDRKLMPKGLKLQILQVNNTTKKIGNTEYYLTKAKVLEAAEANATNKTSTYTKDEELWFAAFKKDGSLQSSAPQKTDLFKETIPAPASTNTTETDKKASEDTTKPTTANKTNKLTFYSLYMHLLPYEEYPTSKDEIKRQAKVVTDGLRARDKIIDDKSTQVIGNISKGTLVNILEVREDEAGNNNCAKVTIAENSGKITLVNQQTKKAEEVMPPAEGFWIVLKDKQTNNGKITWRELAKELPLPKREYPSYWAKQVTAKVTLKEMNIRQAPEAGSDIAGATLAVKLKKDDEVTYSNSKVKSLKISGKTYRMAECKLTKNKTEFTEKGITTFWACVENNYMTTINAEPSTFDTVDASNKIKISAGEPVGYLGLYEVPTSPTGGKSDKPKKQVHIEVFTLAEETELKKFLDNEAGLTGGKQYIQIPKGTVLGKQTENTQSSTGDDSTPQTNSEKKEAPTAVKQLQDNYYQTKYDHIITPDRAKLVNNKYLVTIYENRQSITGVVAKAKTTSISQYELSKLGFTIIKEENPQADGSVSTTTDGFIEQDKMTPFFQDICKEIDSKDNGGDGDGKLSLPELRSALKDPVLSDKWSKLIAYHPTEWQAKGDDPKWQRLISDILPGDANKALREHEKERITNLVFWDDVPDLQGKKEAYHFHPVAFVEHLQSSVSGQIIFPLKVKPKNDKEGVWKNYYWAASLKDSNASQAIFGRNRSGGARKHAARDLYTEPLTEIVAICDGEVKSISTYYYGTWQITIKHETNDGRKFFIRYGEVDPKSIVVKVGDKVKQGNTIAKTGLMINPKTNQHPSIISGQTVYMIHFEYYTGSDGLETPPPNNTGGTVPPYDRRKDIHDPLDILQEGYKNTFENGAKTAENDSRIDVNLLNVSDKGKAFIKEWEGFYADAYNDSEGYCTIGYGHLIEKKKCEDITLPEEFKNGITKQKANELFESRITNYVAGLKNSVTVKLHQYEFDALVSLLFNIGASGLDKKAPSLKKKLNNSDYKGAATEFLDITNGGTSGLVKRRKSENNLFLNNIYDASH